MGGRWWPFSADIRLPAPAGRQLNAIGNVGGRKRLADPRQPRLFGIDLFDPTSDHRFHHIHVAADLGDAQPLLPNHLGHLHLECGKCPALTSHQFLLSAWTIHLSTCPRKLDQDNITRMTHN